MPSWGRPSGARQAKRRKDRGVYKQSKEELRFQEIDSDSDDGQGVNIDGSFESDQLYFTGADLGAHVRARPDEDYKYDSQDSDEESGRLENAEGTMQLALRDKEELLVQKALERIRRAQILGKTNVKLSQPELDALERKRRKDQSIRKRSGSNLRVADKRRSSGTSTPSSKEQVYGKKSRQSLLPHHDQVTPSSHNSAPTPPGLLYAGHNGPSYAPLGYYPSAGPFRQAVGPESHIPNSPQIQQIKTGSVQQPKVQDQRKRNSSGSPAIQQAPLPVKSDRPRRLPDDPGWSPRSRSASSHQTYSVDPFQYQQYSPLPPQMPPQYSQNRRIVSSPPDVQYPHVQYSSVRRTGVPTLQQPAAASSEPSLLPREQSSPHQAVDMESDDDSEDSEDYGVQVNVVPYYDVRAESDRPANRQRRSLR